MIQDQEKPTLLVSILYFTVTTSFMSVFLLSSLIHALQSYHDDADVSDVRTRNFVQIGFCSVFLLLTFALYLSVEYKIRKGSLQVPNVQQNVLTFKQSCISYTIFVLSRWLVFVLLINSNNSYFSKYKTRLITSIIFIVDLFVFHFFIPLVVIVNLNRVMPQLFIDTNENDIEFYYNLTSSYPREQQFLPYKPFKSNARFGSEKKFMKRNESSVGSTLKDIETVEKIHCPSLTNVEI